MDTEELRTLAARLIERADRLDAGETLCEFYWSGDPGWECFCPGCNKHIAEVSDELYIPFKKDAYCAECRSKGKHKSA